MRLGRVHQRELDLDRGAQLPEGGDRARDDRPRRGGEGGHAQAPARLRGDLAELGLGGRDLGEDALGVADEHLAAGGEADAARLALDQLHADLFSSRAICCETAGWV